jgi:hypothetical protein
MRTFVTDGMLSIGFFIHLPTGSTYPSSPRPIATGAGKNDGLSGLCGSEDILYRDDVW